MLKNICIVTLMLVATSIFGEEPKPAPPVPNPAPIPSAVPLTAPTPPATTAPKAAVSKPAGQDWAALLERLRLQPRAGDLNNGALMARLSDIFCDSGESKFKAIALQTEYDRALLERGMKWENELKELRAQFEERIIQECPEAKRESAKKLLDASRAKWAEAGEREAKIRAEFMDRMRMGVQAASATKPSPGNSNAAPGPIRPVNPTSEASNWMKDERAKSAALDAETVQALRALLSKEDAEKLDHNNRMRPAMLPPHVVQNPASATAIPPRPPAEAPTAKPVIPVVPVVPSTTATPTSPAPIPVPAPTSPTETTKNSATEKK